MSAAHAPEAAPRVYERPRNASDVSESAWMQQGDPDTFRNVRPSVCAVGNFPGAIYIDGQELRRARFLPVVG